MEDDGLVVFLEDAKGVDEAHTDKDDGGGCGNNDPSGYTLNAAAATIVIVALSGAATGDLYAVLALKPLRYI